MLLHPVLLFKLVSNFRVADSSPVGYTTTAKETEWRRKAKEVMICSLWSANGDLETCDDTIETTESSDRSGDLSSRSLSHAQHHQAGVLTLELEPDFETAKGCPAREETQKIDTCQLCSQSFERGQVVAESNNPDCQHQFHKACLEKWLQYQNSCPTCNAPYLLLTV